VLPDTDARQQAYVPRRAASGRGRAPARNAGAAEALADPYPGRHGYAQPETYEEPDGYGDSRAYSEPHGYQAARGRLYAVPSESDYLAESPRPARDPRRDAAAIRQAAEQEAAEIRQQAAEEAAALTRQASEHAAKIREAAEKEAAELRAALQTMQGELGRVAAYVTENLTVPAIPAARPAEAPVTRPTRLPARPAGLAPRPADPTTQPAGPATRPARQTQPGTRQASPGARPNTSGRQAKVMRRMVAAFAIASVFGSAAGLTELAMHGLPFFMFRANGAGASEIGPKEPVNPVVPQAPTAPAHH
jgi:hypothetical protein